MKAVHYFAHQSLSVILVFMIVVLFFCSEESGENLTDDNHSEMVADISKATDLYYPRSEGSYMLMNLGTGAGNEAYSKLEN